MARGSRFCSDDQCDKKTFLAPIQKMPRKLPPIADAPKKLGRTSLTMMSAEHDTDDSVRNPFGLQPRQQQQYPRRQRPDYEPRRFANFEYQQAWPRSEPMSTHDTAHHDRPRLSVIRESTPPSPLAPEQQYTLQHDEDDDDRYHQGVELFKQQPLDSTAFHNHENVLNQSSPILGPAAPASLPRRQRPGTDHSPGARSTADSPVASSSPAAAAQQIATLRRRLSQAQDDRDATLQEWAAAQSRLALERRVWEQEQDEWWQQQAAEHEAWRLERATYEAQQEEQEQQQQQQLAQHQAQLATLEQDVVTKQEELAALKDRIQLFVQEDGRSRAAAQTAAQAAADALAAVQQQIHQAQQQYEQEQEQQRALQLELARNKEQWQAEIQEITHDVQQHADSCRATLVQNIQSLVQTLQQHADWCLADLPEPLENEAAALEERIDALQPWLEQISLQYRAAAAQLRRDEAQCQARAARLDEQRRADQANLASERLALETLTEEQITTLQEQWDSERTEMNKSVQQLQTEQSELQSQLETMVAQLGQTENLRNQADSELKESQNRVQQLQVERNELQRRLEDQKRKHNQSESLLNQSETERAEMQNRLQQLVKDQGELQSQVQELQTQLGQSETRWNQSDTERSKIQNIVHQMEAERSELQSKLDELQKKHSIADHRLSDELKRTKSELARTKQECIGLETRFNLLSKKSAAGAKERQQLEASLEKFRIRDEEYHEQEQLWIKRNADLVALADELDARSNELEEQVRFATQSRNGCVYSHC
jgi:chromosome segregation ATPase